MKVTKVCCQGCGADLDVSEGIRFVTCNYCHSKLEIVHGSSVTHSKVLEKLERKTKEMSDDLKVIRLQNELEKLDREWGVLQERFMTSGENGQRSLPSSGGSVFAGLMGIVGGVVWMVATSSMGAPGPFPLFGLVIIGFSVFGMIHGSRKAQEYNSARALMDRRRGKLLEQLAEAKQGR